MHPDIEAAVDRYYTVKLSEFGATPQGADWNGVVSQTLRFRELSRLIVGRTEFSLIDLGCGYGALFDYLNMHFENFRYVGLDLSSDMVQAARQRIGSNPRVDLKRSSTIETSADYVVACGIFNVQLQFSDAEWEHFIFETLESMNRYSDKGFAFNCLTKYSDPEKRRNYLYYADPCALFDHCMRSYSPHVYLLHDYGLYDFTVGVRKVI